ncbi:hypothetical protein HD554DRAFT_1174452 [Boletus coccyginus]|nr:hypothetical protein HD554DRAFT_1174452 [Boletus coccyginus]
MPLTFPLPPPSFPSFFFPSSLFFPAIALYVVGFEYSWRVSSNDVHHSGSVLSGGYTTAKTFPRTQPESESLIYVSTFVCRDPRFIVLWYETPRFAHFRGSLKCAKPSYDVPFPLLSSAFQRVSYCVSVTY